MIREELALVKQNGAKRMIWPFLPLFNLIFLMLRVDPSPVLFYFYFFIRSELVRVDPS